MQLRILFSVILLALRGNSLIAQNCDCLIYPMSRECREQCKLNFINTASQTELSNTLRITGSTARQILRFRRNSKVTKLEDLRTSLSRNNYNAVQFNYTRLNDSEIINHFNKKKGELEKIIGEWKYTSVGKDFTLKISKIGSERYEASLVSHGIKHEGFGYFSFEKNKIVFDITRTNAEGCTSKLTWEIAPKDQNMIKMVENAADDKCGQEIFSGRIYEWPRLSG